MKGSVQQCVKSEIDVLIKDTLNVFIWVIYIRIGKWPNDEIIMIAMIFLTSFKLKTWISYHLSLCHKFWRNMLSRLNILLHGALQMNNKTVQGQCATSCST